MLSCHLHVVDDTAPAPCRRSLTGWLSIRGPFRQHQWNYCLWDNYRHSALFVERKVCWPYVHICAIVAVNWVCASQQCTCETCVGGSSTIWPLASVISQIIQLYASCERLRWISGDWRSGYQPLSSDRCIGGVSVHICPHYLVMLSEFHRGQTDRKGRSIAVGRLSIANVSPDHASSAPSVPFIEWGEEAATQ